MTAITPQEYARAVELAKATVAFGDKADAAGSLYDIEAVAIARALLRAHAQRRTVGTIEICDTCRLQNDGRGAGDVEIVHRDWAHCPRVACPIRAGRTEK